MEPNNQQRKAHPVILAAAAAVLLFAVAGTAALMGWLPNSRGQESEQTAAQKEPVKRASTETIRKQAEVGDLGVIESVREVSVKGEGSGLGAVAGGVAGGVVGHQIGGGRGKDVMTVVGVVGGGLAGHEAEKRIRATKTYEVTVRFDNGTTKVYNRTSAPSFKSGERVRVVDGDIQYV